MIAAIVAALGLPFYLGLVHLPISKLVAYCAVAGSAMAIGQHADTPKEQRGGLELLLCEFQLWVALIFLAGGISYAIALIF